jgi:hypothetical protein
MQTRMLALRRLGSAPTRWLGQTRRDRALRRGLRSVRSGPWDDLVFGWGNEYWSALPEYLEAVVLYGRSARGPVLECGTGLTTLVLAAIGADVWALESNEEWRARVETELARNGLSAHVMAAPLRDYGDFDWYDVDPASMPRFSLVVCDGPSSATRGGRYGLLPVMGGHLAHGCNVLLDDVDREGEKQVLASWRDDVESCDVRGAEHPYSILRLR